MAGHSHFKNIKRRKEAVDQKKSATFSRISRIIVSAVREKGKDPATNATLRTAIEKAKEADMPAKNIEKAIKRGSGEGEEGNLEYFLFEAYSSENTAIIIEGSTDNRNRNLGEIKEILKRHNGKLADPGSVKWLFEQVGIIEIEKLLVTEELSLEIIESGARDIEEKKELVVIYTSPSDFKKVKDFLERKNITISSAVLGWTPKTKTEKKDEKINNLIKDLHLNESVEGVYVNL
jgi:YebC/PmpR family DNA-binding regulatory protein